MASTSALRGDQLLAGSRVAFHGPQRTRHSCVQCHAALNRNTQRRSQQQTLGAKQQLCQFWRESALAQQLAVGLAAVVLTTAAPADAGVVYEKKATRKLFQSDDVAPVKKESVKSGGGEGLKLPSIGAPKLPSLPSGGGGGKGGGFDLGGSLPFLTLPLAIGAIGVGAFAWRAVDPTFSKFMDDAMAKNSNTEGAGYEFGMKSGNLPKKMAGATRAKGKPKATAKKAAKKGEQTRKKGLLSF